MGFVCVAAIQPEFDAMARGSVAKISSPHKSDMQTPTKAGASVLMYSAVNFSF